MTDPAAMTRLCAFLTSYGSKQMSPAEKMLNDVLNVCGEEASAWEKDAAEMLASGNGPAHDARRSYAFAVRKVATRLAALPLPADDRDAEIARVKARADLLEQVLTVAAATMDAMHPSERQLTDAEAARLWNATRDKIDAALSETAP